MRPAPPAARPAVGITRTVRRIRRPVRAHGPALTRRAFTLIEVLAAVAVLALVLMTSITTLQRAFSNLDTARNVTLANSILQAELEKERLFSWSKLNDSTYQPTIDAGLLSNPNIAGRFTLSRTTSTVSGRTDRMVQVTLTVRWRSYDGRTITRNVTSNFSNSGLNDLFIAQF